MDCLQNISLGLKAKAISKTEFQFEGCLWNKVSTLHIYTSETYAPVSPYNQEILFQQIHMISVRGLNKNKTTHSLKLSISLHNDGKLAQQTQPQICLNLRIPLQRSICRSHRVFTIDWSLVITCFNFFEIWISWFCFVLFSFYIRATNVQNLLNKNPSFSRKIFLTPLLHYYSIAIPTQEDFRWIMKKMQHKGTAWNLWKWWVRLLRKVSVSLWPNTFFSVYCYTSSDKPVLVIAPIFSVHRTHTNVWIAHHLWTDFSRSISLANILFLW